jgi:hypothetical protein
MVKDWPVPAILLPLDGLTEIVAGATEKVMVWVTSDTSAESLYGAGLWVWI